MNSLDSYVLYLREAGFTEIPYTSRKLVENLSGKKFFKTPLNENGTNVVILTTDNNKDEYAHIIMNFFDKEGNFKGVQSHISSFTAGKKP